MQIRATALDKVFILAFSIYCGLVSLNMLTHPAVSNWFDRHDSRSMKTLRSALAFQGLEGAPEGPKRIVQGILMGCVGLLAFVTAIFIILH